MATRTRATAARRMALAGTMALGGAVMVGGAGPAAAAGGTKLVFVTSQVYNGNLGGLQGADQKCQALATAAHLKGTYRAWLSDSTASPSTRFVKSTRPYKLVHGPVIAKNWADLTDGTLRHTINVTERGTVLDTEGVSIPVWTATGADGTFHGAQGDCEDWSYPGADDTGGIGSGSSRDFSWTEGSIFACAFGLNLYCFQQ